MIDQGFALIVAGGFAAVPAALTGLGAWRAAVNNASQESVDTLARRVDETQASVDTVHDCLNAHTKQDDENFKALNGRMDEAQADRDADRGERVATAEHLADLTKVTAAALALTVPNVPSTGDKGAT